MGFTAVLPHRRQPFQVVRPVPGKLMVCVLGMLRPAEYSAAW